MTHIPRKMCHVFGDSKAIVTHIPLKMCHVFGVSTAIVTHIPLKMCHVFGVSKEISNTLLTTWRASRKKKAPFC